MYVAIVAEADDLKALIPKNFKDAKVLMIINGDTNEMCNVYGKEDEENITFAELIVEHDCEVLITGAMDQRAFEIVVDGNVTRYDGSTRKVQKAYDYFKRGQLTLIRDYINGPGAVGHTHDYSCDCGDPGHEETEHEPIFDAVISAAGLSSRMGDFKPLMQLGGRVNLIRQMETFFESGVRHITIVVGHRQDEIRQAVENAFEASAYTLIENPKYATTQMFDSVKIGMEAAIGTAQIQGLPEADGIFYVPVDIPLFTVHSVDTLMDHFSYGGQDVFQPEYQGKAGHPLLIRRSSLEKILNGDDSQGLRSALAQDGITIGRDDVPDRGVILDADTPEEFRVLEAEVQNRKAPDEETCRRILVWAGVQEDGIRHALAVAAAADEICEQCTAAGYGSEIHPEQIHSAALLHDVLKGMEKHEARGGQLLKDLDMAAIGRIAETHSDLPEEEQRELNDRLILFLADKLVSGDRRVSMDSRFEEKRKKFAGNRIALKSLEKRYQMAKNAYDTAVRSGWKDAGQ